MRLRSTFALALSLVLGAGVVVSCGGDKDKKQPPPVDKPPPTKTLDPATAGAIKGTVLFEGTPPADKELLMSEIACKQVHGGKVYQQKVLVKDGKLANAFVYIKDGLDGYAFEPPAEEVVLNQHGCIYEPLVVGVMAGQEITFVNSDTVLHNIHTLPKENDGHNFAMPSKGMRTTKTFDYQEVMVRTKCDVHPWMRAYIGVVEHPYFAVTGADGAFELNNVPPGDYTLEIWHEEYGRQTKQVTVTEKATAEVSFGMTYL